MPYRNKSELPDGVKNTLPDHAQEIYKETFNRAYDQYRNPNDRQGDSDREDTATK